MLKTLNLVAATRLLKDFIPMGDNYYEYGGQLIEQGFIGLKAYQDYHELLVENEEELALHRKIRIEKAKERAGVPFLLLFGPHDSSAYQAPYESELLARLRQERDPGGRLAAEIRAKNLWDEKWRLEIDPD